MGTGDLTGRQILAGEGRLARMRGILGWATYLPARRLDRSQIGAFVGQGGGKGTRTVASYDEDSTTMAVAAAQALGAPDGVDQLLLATTSPAYAEKTNATAVHAALQLPADTLAVDLGAATRSTIGGLLLALSSTSSTLLCAADVRTGLPGSADEAAGGDGAAAVLIGEGGDGHPVLAEPVATASVTTELVDRWRTPGETRTKTWDDRFAEVTYTRGASEAWNRALERAGASATDVAALAVAAATPRLAATIAARLKAANVVTPLAERVGNLGAAEPLAMLAALLEQAEPGQLVALVGVADGVDVVLLRTTDALAGRAGTHLADQAAGGRAVPYGKFLAWRGMLAVEPPRRPEPARVSATAAARSTSWKFGFVASRDASSGQTHLPPQRVSADGTRTDEMTVQPMAGTEGTVVTFTVDRMAYSPSPPVVFAVVDFDGGGRLPIELCDVDAADVRIGMRVRPTFRRLFVQDGIPNYFWKARPADG